MLHHAADHGSREGERGEDDSWDETQLLEEIQLSLHLRGDAPTILFLTSSWFESDDFLVVKKSDDFTAGGHLHMASELHSMVQRQIVRLCASSRG